MATRNLSTLRRNLLPIAGFRDPSSVSGLLAWYDLSDASLLATSNNGTGAVTSGSTVGYAADKSGNGWHLTQSVANNRPTWNGSANGRTVLTFDGSNDVLSSSAAWPLAGDPAWSIFSVHTRAVTTSGFPVSWGTRAGGSVNVNDDSVGRWIIGIAGAAFFITATSSAVNTPQLVSATKTAGRLGIATFRNGSYSITGSVSPGAITVASGALNLGLAVAGPSSHNGTICEVVIYSRSLGTDERRNVESWLGARWGITVT